MIKDPAFLFYSSDFLTGVSTMNFDDRGKYITLLATMHQKGRLSDETIRFLVGSPSVSLSEKFKQDDKGFWYNERLESEIDKRRSFIDSRRENGQKGGRPKKPSGKPLGGATDNLPENENVDTVLRESKDKEYTKEQIESFEKFDKWLIENAPRVKQMKVPFNPKSYESCAKYFVSEFKGNQAAGKKMMMDIFINMQNNAKLLKNNLDANLTVRNWYRMAKERKAEFGMKPEQPTSIGLPKFNND